MSFWSKTEDELMRSAWRVLDRSNVTYYPESDTYKVTGGDSQRLSSKTCEGFDLLREKDFLEIDDGWVRQTHAGIDWWHQS